MIDYFNEFIRPESEKLKKLLDTRTCTLVYQNRNTKTTQLAPAKRTRKIIVKYEPGAEDWEYTYHSNGVLTWISLF